LPPLGSCRCRVISSQIGWRKPSAEFYRNAELQLRLRPEQLLLIGDDYNADYVGAQRAGWQAVLLDRKSSAQQAFSVRSLAEVPALIANA
jgi:putative hydrolase of the HAD superfamily